jgi:hypothetical protein
MIKRSASTVALCLSTLMTTAWADSCPIPTTSIDPVVTAKVTYDKASKVFTYSYSVNNSAGSQLPIDEFDLALPTQPNTSSSPDQWRGHFSGRQSIFIWSTSALKPGAVAPAPGLLPPAGYSIKPGEKLSGFSIKSSQPPGAQQFFSSGEFQPAIVAPTNTEDEPLPDCPGIDIVNPRIQTLVTGLTIGPLPPNTVSPKMRLRDSSGKHKCGPIDPSQPTGNVTLLILSSPDFDASQINVDSVKFGPAQVAPVSSKIVSREDKDDRDDESEEWEKFVDHSKNEKSGKNDSKLKNLLLTFDLKSLDVQCVLDRALFLNATTNSGQKVVGGVSTRTVGCNVTKPGVHARHLRQDDPPPTRMPLRRHDYKGKK